MYWTATAIVYITACSLRLAPFRGTDLFFDDHDEWIRL